MKKLLIIPALIGTMAVASDYNYEITPVIGYNVAEGNLNLNNAFIGGIEAQYNGFDSAIKPELSILYSDGVKSDDINPELKTNIYRVALNGVYELEKTSIIIPFIKAGIGYETMNRDWADNSDGGFVDAGAGVKIPFADNLALKLETLYMLKYNDNSAGDNWGDSNLAVLAGLNYAFGKKAQPEPEPTPEPEPAPAPEPVDGDDDNDGVLNSVDECPTTPAGKEVDSKGCCVVVDGDDDNDGVLNSVDQCPNTPASVIKVDAEGCAETINLHVKFEFDSYEVTDASIENIKKFGEFMNDRANYKAKIVGHTDSYGSAAYNQVLSEKRAKVVTDLIVSEGGVAADRLTSMGKGESEPMVANDTKENRAQNRRTVAELIKE
jgi:OOP family OmpA-OmpF porin